MLYLRSPGVPIPGASEAISPKPKCFISAFLKSISLEPWKLYHWLHISPMPWRLYLRSLYLWSLEAVSLEEFYNLSTGGYISGAQEPYHRSPGVPIPGALELEAMSLKSGCFISAALKSIYLEPWKLYHWLHISPKPWRALSTKSISLEPGGSITGATEELYNLRPGDYILGTPETISLSTVEGLIFGALKPPSGAVKAPLGVIGAEGPSLDMWKPNEAKNRRIYYSFIDLFFYFQPHDLRIFCEYIFNILYL
jgi:hypothetical protein